MGVFSRSLRLRVVRGSSAHPRTRVLEPRNADQCNSRFGSFENGRYRTDAGLWRPWTEALDRPCRDRWTVIREKLASHEFSRTESATPTPRTMIANSGAGRRTVRGTLLEAPNDTDDVAAGLQMIDGAIIRAHHCAAGAKGGLEAGPWANPKVA